MANKLQEPRGNVNRDGDLVCCGRVFDPEMVTKRRRCKTYGC